MANFTVTENMTGTTLRSHTVFAASARDAAMMIADESSIYIGDGAGHTSLTEMTPRKWLTKSGNERTIYRFGVSGYMEAALTDFVLTVEKKTLVGQKAR